MPEERSATEPRNLNRPRSRGRRRGTERPARSRFDQAKAGADLAALFLEYGVDLKPNGKGLRGRCPWHEDRTPSLSVSPEKGLFHCFGCGKAGSAIDLVMLQEGVTKEAAVEKLLGQAPRASKPKKSVGSETEAAAPSAPEPEPVEVPADFLDQAATHYHEALDRALTARNYLAKRGLCDGDLLQHFQIGCGDGTIKTHIPAAEGIASGVLTKRGTDFFYRSVVFPLRDAEGRVVSFYARHVYKTRHLFLKGPHRGLFNRRGVRAQRSIVLTESVIDALSAIRLGVTNVLPLYGVRGLTDDHKALIEDEDVEEVTLILDNDDAGEDAVESLAEALAPLGVAVFRARLPVGIKDLNEFLVKGRTTDELRTILDRRERVRAQGKPGEPAEPVGEAAATSATKTPVGEEPPRARVRAVQLVTATRKTTSKAAATKKKAVRAKTPVGEVAVEAATSAAPAGSTPPVAEESVPAEGDAVAPTAPEASPQPADPAGPEDPADANDPAAHGVVSFEDGCAVFELDGLGYEVRGIRLRSETTMRVLVLLEAEAGVFRDRPDLYLYRSRRAFAGEAASRLGIDPDRVMAHLSRLVCGIEAIQAREIARLEAPTAKKELTDEERQEAMTLLEAPDILEAIARDLDRLGYVGEAPTKKVAYLIATSRRTERPLSCILRSSSGSGKSRLMEMIASLMPEEEVEYFSRITPQSLYYMGKDELAHKLLVIDERAGGEDADYAIRSLQTRRKLTLATPMRDPSSGKMRTMTFEVNGPVALMESTTAATINAENANRCYELYLDESSAQTQRIQAAQRRIYRPDGWLQAGERERILSLHRNAQRLLRPVRVAIPFADAIRFPASWIRTRRDHERFLALIAMRAFLYQHQRPTHRDGSGLDYIEATADDYAEAYQLAHTALASSLQDLSRPGQDLLVVIRAYVAANAKANGIPLPQVTFTRRQLREAIRWPDKRLRAGLRELVDLEELVLVSGQNGLRFTYRLAAVAPTVREVLRGLSTPDEIQAACR